MYNPGGVIIELDTSQSSSDYGKKFYGQKTREILVYRKFQGLDEVLEKEQRTSTISPMIRQSEITLEPTQNSEEKQPESNDDAKQEPDDECEILTKDTLKRPYVF